MDPQVIQELTIAVQELQTYLGVALSFFAGLSTGISFVLASKMEWFK